MRILSLLCFVIISFFVSFPLAYSYDNSPPCFRSLASHFFDNVTVSQALSLHRVDPGSWTPIYEDLSYQSGAIQYLVEEEAKKLTPNPLSRPFDPIKAQEVLMKVLYTVFYNTLINHEVTNQSDIQEMFGFIRDHNKKRIESCFLKAQKNRTR